MAGGSEPWPWTGGSEGELRMRNSSFDEDEMRNSAFEAGHMHTSSSDSSCSEHLMFSVKVSKK